MSKIADLVERYETHISLPWQTGLAGAERLIFVVYEPELERRLRAYLSAFEHATQRAGKRWRLVDVTNAFAEWIRGDEYRDDFFQNPPALGMRLEHEFPEYVAGLIGATLREADEETVVAALGAGALYGLTRLSTVLRRVEGQVPGRLVMFFPGERDGNQYSLLGARDGWTYLAIPIS